MSVYRWLDVTLKKAVNVEDFLNAFPDLADKTKIYTDPVKKEIHVVVYTDLLWVELKNILKNYIPKI